MPKNIFEKIILGEQPKKAGENFKELADTFRKKFLEAFKSLTGEGSHFGRNEVAIRLVTNEANTSGRHFCRQIDAKGPWSTPAFWNDLAQITETAVSSAASRLLPAFNQDGTPDTTEEGVKKYKAGYGTPGPVVPNRVYDMELMARLNGNYRYDLHSNEALRIQIAKEVDEELAGIGMYALSDFVIDELKLMGEKRVPNKGAIRKLKAPQLYSRLSHVVNAKGQFREEYLSGQQLTVESSSVRRTPKQDAFLRLALVGAHATWEAPQLHRAAYEEKPDRLTDEDFGPLPDVMREMYVKLTNRGVTPEDAVLNISLVLFKDVGVLRKGKDIPDADMFATEAARKERKEPSSVPAALAVGALAGLAGVAAIQESPKSLNELYSSPQKERSVVEGDFVRSAVAALPREGEGNTETIGENPRTALQLVGSLVRQLNTRPDLRAEFEKRFPMTEGQTVEERVWDLTERFDLLRPGIESALILPGDYIEFRPEEGTFLVNIGGAEPLQIAGADGEEIEYRGLTLPDTN